MDKYPFPISVVRNLEEMKAAKGHCYVALVGSPAKNRPYGWILESVELVVTPGQEWRTDTEYIAKRGLNVKYVWLEYQGVKVYYQLGTVNYANYLVDHYYVSVLELD